jgi:hypothetical protein
MANKALHLTAFPLRSKAAGELGRWAACVFATAYFECKLSSYSIYDTT